MMGQPTSILRALVTHTLRASTSEQRARAHTAEGTQWGHLGRLGLGLGLGVGVGVGVGVASPQARQ